LTSIAVKVPVPASGCFFSQGPVASAVPPRSMPFAYLWGFFGTLFLDGALTPEM